MVGQKGIETSSRIDQHDSGLSLGNFDHSDNDVDTDTNSEFEAEAITGNEVTDFQVGTENQIDAVVLTRNEVTTDHHIVAKTRSLQTTKLTL